jgi:hypothetical protein
MMLIGKLEARQRLTVVRSDWGQESMGPSGVPDQSLERIKSARSLPPERKSGAGLLWASGDPFIDLYTSAQRPSEVAVDVLVELQSDPHLGR